MDYRRVAIDTSVLIDWLSGNEAATDLQRCARWLFEELSAKQIEVVIPVAAVTEALVQIEADRRAAWLADLESRFELAPFDVRCCVVASGLTAEALDEHKRSKRDGKAKPDGRVKAKADSVIIATAKCHGAAAIYTGDEDFAKLARRAGIDGLLVTKVQPPHLFAFVQESPKIDIRDRSKKRRGGIDARRKRTSSSK